MTSRDRIVILIVAVVGALAASWFMLIQPKRQQASDLAGKISTAQSQLDAARQQVLAGEQARSAFAANYTQLAKLGEAVPTDDNIPSLIYQLQGAAGGNHVDFRSLEVMPAAASSSSAPSSSSSSGSSSNAAPAILPPGVGIGAAGFPAEQFNFSFRGNFFHLANFFNNVQHFVVPIGATLKVSGRLMSVNAITFSAVGFPLIDASVSATTYLLPTTQGLTDGASPTTGPAGSTIAPPSSSTSSHPASAAVLAPSIR
jgi:type II secretory pathway pseudopilin PulG